MDLNLGLGLFLLPRWHITGMAVAVLVDTLTFHALALVQTWRIERVHPFELALLVPLTSSLAIPIVHLVAGLWLRGFAAVTFVIVVGSAAYLGLLRVFGGASRNLPGLEQNRA